MDDVRISDSHVVGEPIPLPSLLKWVVIALFLRLGLSAISTGSDDAIIWTSFAKHIWSQGVSGLYAVAKSFNHPPIAGYYAGLVYGVSEATGIGFPFLFRLAPIAADVITLVALARLTRQRWIVAAFALDPVSILISGFHTNTDSVYSNLLLFGISALSMRRFFVGGLFLGAALNVKLFPLIVILPLLASMNILPLIRVMTGAMPWSFPYAMMTLLAGRPFLDNLFAYSGILTYWGTGYLLSFSSQATHPSPSSRTPSGSPLTFPKF